MLIGQYLASHPFLIAALVVWTLPWKGVALWKAGRRKDLAWFVALLLVNTLGVLEIIYIFMVANRPKK
ncbi:MAG: hypothetical protein COU07_00745 [Candidatus Harrisonbacteria bacterium CG10_big_fil_rev_8_21_14_0_10_40_38]|uniref:DUF5652 domain-containing protein n=1 Tax=Candidatus Harrisonbacteria bacterium CG10_big_fil_rev_8_21_14_0_10_40_38 TaxID=1974583 RepID=A0A2H0USR0_9BACT|nr:MAG: hypothetical protein COU07_00745 [Candidatus Harrisonbacteria bacterium CG10_big_fil_rev_8_21_14_0_10_40_38]